MKSSPPLLLNSPPSQENFVPSSNGNRNGHQAPVVHQRRFAHYSWCGKDLDFYLNAIASGKASLVTCKTCLRARGKLLSLRKKARAWEREHNPSRPTVVVVKQPASLTPTGWVAVEQAFRDALERAEASR